MTPTPDPVLVYDGGCPFCSHFAVLSELRGGIPGLRIVDGRDAAELRQRLAERGFHLRDGAMLLQGEQVLHGAAAITWICGRLRPSAPLLPYQDAATPSPGSNWDRLAGAGIECAKPKPRHSIARTVRSCSAWRSERSM